MLFSNLSNPLSNQIFQYFQNMDSKSTLWHSTFDDRQIQSYQIIYSSHLDPLRFPIFRANQNFDSN